MGGIGPNENNGSNSWQADARTRRHAGIKRESKLRRLARLHTKLENLAHFAGGTAIGASAKAARKLIANRAKEISKASNPGQKIVDQIKSGELGTEANPLGEDDFRKAVQYCPLYKNFDNVVFQDGIYLGSRGKRKCDLRGYSFRNARMHQVNFDCTNLNFADFTGANLEGAEMIRTSLNGAVLERAKLKGANLMNAFMRNANLRFADLRETVLDHTFLCKADCTGADFTDVKNMEHAYLDGTDFTRANFTRVKFEYVGLGEVSSFKGANFTDATLAGYNLSRLDFREANFTRANLQGVNLDWANAENANFTDADTEGARLSRAKLKGTILEKKTEAYYPVPATVDQMQAKKEVVIPLASFDKFDADEINDKLKEAYKAALEHVPDAKYITYDYDKDHDFLVIKPINSLTEAEKSTVIFFTHQIPETDATGYYHIANYKRENPTEVEISTLLEKHAEGVTKLKKAVRYEYRNDYTLENSAPDYLPGLEARLVNNNARYYFDGRNVYESQRFQRDFSPSSYMILMNATSQFLKFSEDGNAIGDRMELDRTSEYDDMDLFFSRAAHELFHLLEQQPKSLSLGQKLKLLRYFQGLSQKGIMHKKISEIFENYGKEALFHYKRGNVHAFDEQFGYFFRNMTEQISRVFFPSEDGQGRGGYRFAPDNVIPQEALEFMVKYGYSGVNSGNSPESN